MPAIHAGMTEGRPLMYVLLLVCAINFRRSIRAAWFASVPRIQQMPKARQSPPTPGASLSDAYKRSPVCTLHYPETIQNPMTLKIEKVSDGQKT
jgi:hypothetical protein